MSTQSNSEQISDDANAFVPEDQQAILRQVNNLLDESARLLATVQPQLTAAQHISLQDRHNQLYLDAVLAGSTLASIAGHSAQDEQSDPSENANLPHIALGAHDPLGALVSNDAQWPQLPNGDAYRRILVLENDHSHAVVIGTDPGYMNLNEDNSGNIQDMMRLGEAILANNPQTLQERQNIDQETSLISRLSLNLASFIRGGMA